MRVERVVPNLTVADLNRSVEEHQSMLGFEVLMDHGWIVSLGGSAGHQLSLMTADATAPVNPDISVFVDDVREALGHVENAGVEIVHPLSEEPWGVTRFFYRDSQGRVVNVGMHTA